MTHDERWLKAMHITPEPILPVSQGKGLPLSPCPHQQKQETVVQLWRAEEEGCLTLAEEDWWKTMEIVKALEQSKADLENTVQNWLEQARENHKAMRVWRNVCLVLGGCMVLIEGSRVWAAWGGQ
jgi:hypothetical protein